MIICYFMLPDTTFGDVWRGDGMRGQRRMGVATARPSVSVLQTHWRTVVLAVGRFGGGSVGALASTARQTLPTYVPERRCSP